MLPDKLTSLARLTDALSRARSAAEVYAASLDSLQESLGVERASILLFNDEEVMTFVAWRGISDAYRQAVNGHTPWRPDSRDVEPVLVRDGEADPSLAKYLDLFRAEGIRALGFFALTHRGRVIGKFMLYYGAPHDFTTEEIALAKTIAGQIAFGLTRILAEEALEAERARLAATVANVPGMVWETIGTFPDEQRVTFVSDGIRDLVGYEPQEWLDDPSFWSRIIVDRSQPQVDVVAENAVRENAVAVHQYKLRRRDGRTIWVEVRTAQTMVNGTLVSRGVTTDITMRKEAEARNAFFSEAAGVLSASLDYEKSLAQIADLIAGSLGDWCVIDLVEEEEVVRIAAAHRDTSKGGTMRRLQTEFAPSKNEIGIGRHVFETNTPLLLENISPEFRERIRQATAAPVLDEIGCESLMVVPMTAGGRVFGTIAIASTAEGRHYDRNDLAIAVELGLRAGYAIDHARLYRTARAANRAKDDFLATLSHELRTPMTAALGWASMLRSRDLSAETQQVAAETIERSIRTQAKLIDDIFDVSRIITGKLQLQIAPVDLKQVVAAAVETMQPGIQAKALRVEIEFENQDEMLLADAGRLQQVIWNLLSNAVKFTPSHGLVRVEVKRPSAESVEISVGDTGQGISKRLLPFVFDRFRQGDSSATRAHGGLGLGLAIVKSIVEMHGGTVAAESEGEGSGARFTIRLPRAEASKGVAADPTREPRISLAGVTVLLVEDDDDTRVMMTRALEQHGANVIAVVSASAALDAMRATPPTVVVSDIAMPGEDGVSLMMKIRGGAVESCRDVPAIAVSAFARPEDRDRILAAGFREQLAKPVDALTMLQTVRRALPATSADLA
jgi:PAS domain S-box-containing protein